MKEIRLVVLDVDGTICNGAGEVPGAVVEAVSRARRRGMDFALATGRTLAGTLPVAAQLGITNPLIIHNGARIVDPERGRDLHVKPLPLSSMRTLVERLGGQEAFYAYLTARGPTEGIYYHGPWEHESLIHYLKTELDFLHPLAAPVVPDGHEPLRVFARVPVEHRERLSEANGDYQVIPWPELLFEFMAPGVSKGAALRLLARELGVPLEGVAAVGDQINDIEMLQAAGLGVAMGNAVPAVREAARWVTASNDEHGVALLLDRLAG